MTMQTTPLLMHRLLFRGAVVQPDEEIVTLTATGTRRQTVRATAERAHQLAHALAAAGVRPGDRVGTFMWNGSRHWEAYLAIASMGAVLHTLNVRLGAADLEYIVNHAEDSVIIADADLLPLLEPLAAKLPTVRKVVVATEPGCEGWSTSLPAAVDYEDFIGGQPTRYAWPELDENAPLGLCYTSGTTGKPKGVMYTHRSTYLHTLTQCMTDAMGLSALDCCCAIVPMFHAMSWGLPWSASMLGMKVVLPHRFMSPERILDAMANEQVTLSAGVPTIWQGARALIEAEPGRFDLGSVARVTCGGSAPPQSLVEWYWNELGVEMIQGWGMTETSPLGTIARRVSKRAHLGRLDADLTQNCMKAGQALPGIEIEIFDDDWNPLPHDGEQTGELLIRGPWVASEYFNNPQPDKFHDGWLVTGDVARIDSEQNLMIADRSKDLVKSGGEWISSVDLENHIAGRDGVAQACVVAQPHPKWDERPVAVVVLAPGARVSAQEIIDHCATQFAKWQLPDDVIFQDSIPLTSTGKMDKKVVRAALADAGYRLPDLRGDAA